MSLVRHITFVVNGNCEIGYGHIARSLVLAQKFKTQNWEVSFLIKRTSPFISKISEFFPCYSCQDYTEEQVEYIIPNFHSDVVLIDLIEKEYKEFRWIKDKVMDNSLIVSITLFLFDLKTRYERLSFFPSVEKVCQTSNTTNLKLYSGSEYFIFRDEFRLAQRKTQRQNANKILITMGGTDPLGLGLLVLNALLDTSYEITLLSSKQTPSYATIESIIAKNPNKNIRLIDFTSQISHLMIDSDIIILNGGSTRYEACLCQTPFIAISMHEKQFKITEELTKYNVGINLGVSGNINNDKILTSVNELIDDFKKRKQMAINMSNLIDTNGSQRIYKIIASYIEPIR